MIAFSLKRAGLGLQEGARTLIADQSIGSYSTKAGAVFMTACMTACIAEERIPEMNDK
jgi:hypothetical protein